ncbi:bifunctional UDP-N-acetylglucosamine diphosphorylase/glucosamine-1-phosphate N-acetyltransferase GlmU [Salinisphaera sp.]|uniref:bifunctional UDP-N-acetylglucosamine diphosphorylase/glucosamine-1-phosphate N-acetyltransferase GlmU n=1 Tax=Salinisphaera sp. TaxID=1914330 RepID=UPI000C6845AF|nr:bifunctional UDP-N-acetylglucosamine diphosphorylase/glucosamine-1-phosphate N-acetyltransferase GlmU [Salinisphaera sp.]MAS08624.1 UDP-N-acetylglucosamine diphosphorylase/glucosamine-1-phosphate N-acetyltransferase [Salinisphaera sp.]|tara:strand:+ start:3744 stop:5108 length:1365 start_codon:yes stop_codon:yes gene_type:complete
MSLHIVILAAGQGKRMNSALPKVLQPLGDRPLLRHVVETAQALDPAAIHVVYGHGGERVQQALTDMPVNWVYQAEQLGTGHAVGQAMDHVPDDARVLVLYGDVPLVRANTLSNLVAAADNGALALLTVVLADPTGYGRIVRDDNNRVQRIVEERDADAGERHIQETNTGLLCAGAAALRDWLSRLTDDNDQGEYYLTDCVALAAADGAPVTAGQAATEAETQGINNKLDLARAERLFQRRQADALMAAGLTLRDPARFDLRGALRAGRDSEIDVGVVVEGQVTLGDNVVIGPHVVLKNCAIDDDTRIEAHSVIEGATIGRRCAIGPFARLRPDTHVADRAKIGNFVETKKTRLGEASKINHLSYVGDAEVGAGVNIGAGVITCNYDGANKHITRIGDDAFIGSDCQLVAPVSVGAGATIGAGSTVTKDAPAGALTLSRVRQSTVTGWRRPTKQA